MRIASIFLVLLTSCAYTSTCTDTCNMPKLNIDSPEKLTLDKVHVKVESEKEQVFINVPMSEYKKMSINLQKILFYMKTQNKIISAYKKYYEEQNGQSKSN